MTAEFPRRQTCEACGRALRPSWAFCPQCGAETEPRWRATDGE
jgi:uncharacterized OB-fold protein